MKAFLFFFLSTLTLQAQSPLTFEAVEKSEHSAANLRQLTKEWTLKVFNNPKQAIQFEDSTQVIVKTSFKYNQKKKIWGAYEGTKGNIELSIKIQFKEGRYRYEFTDFYHEGKVYSFGLLTDSEAFEGKMPMTMKKWRLNIWTDLKEQSTERAELLINSLTQQMKKEFSNW